jgi:L-Ala-D/L-Glu epimerase
MILTTDIYRYSIPMHPFTIATGTMHYAQNIFIRVHTGDGIYGVGECSAFPMIAGETQSTCFEMAKDFAALWKGKDESDIDGRLDELNAFTAFNRTIKSAFDMALFDLAAKRAGLPLYQYLGGSLNPLQTDLTIGISSAESMATTAREFVAQGVEILKVKLGKDAATDIERIRLIREAVGPTPRIRIDANQGWTYEEARLVLQSIAAYQVEFCEQPMRYWNDSLLPELRLHSPIKIMADESVFDHHDAKRLINAGACDYINIKFAKSGGIREALLINKVCEAAGIRCMMGGMLESRVALTAFAHFATAQQNIIFYDMDTCLLGHKVDPVTGGVGYNNYFVELPRSIGIGADVEESFLSGLEVVRV